jgi:hypothetical protein
MSDIGVKCGPNGFRRGFLIAVALLIFVWSQAYAEDTPVSDKWTFQLTPYVWFLSMDGDATVSGQKASVDIGFDDIFKKLNIAAMIEGEAQYGRFGLYVNTIYADLSANTSGGGTKLDLNAQTLWLGFGAFYRLGPWVLDESASGDAVTVTIDPYVGGRYTYLDVQVNLKPGPSASGDQDWIDPVIGARTIWDLSEHWNITLFGDIGGFGVGSDFTWQAAGLVGYRFGLFGNDDARVLAGYRALYQDYKDGSGANKFEWDMTLYGPILALAVQF